ncbi:MAG TPA: FtsX-like permease family protein [Acidimicrobiales bacterium]|jgi:putative ABC transport system permease protein
MARLLRLLALRPVRQRPLRALLAIIAVAAGTSMAVSVFIVRSSVNESVVQFGRELAGPTELRVVGATRRAGLEAEVADRVAATEGVAAAVPVVQAVTVAESPGPEPGDDPVEKAVLVLGVDCRAEALVGSFGCIDEMVADHGDRPLAVGPGVTRTGRLRTNRGTVSLDGVPRFDALGALGDGQFVVFPLASAQRVFARDGRFDTIYVRPEPGTDVDALRTRLERVVGEHNGVLSADEGPPEVQLFLTGVLPTFTLLALFALGTGAMLVYNTVTLSLEERRRELAVVAALGGSPPVMRTTILGEAAALGLLGGVVGVVAGRLVAGPIVASLSNFTERTAGVPMAVHTGSGPWLFGAVLGVVVAVGAAAVPVRRSLRMDVAGELSGRGLRSEASTPHVLRKASGWLAVMVLGLAMARLAQNDGGLQPWQVPVGALGFAVTTLGMLLAGARLASLGVRPFARLVGESAPGRLAVANLVRAAGRTGVMAAALGAAATTAFVTAGYTNGVRTAITEDIIGNMDGVEVSTVGEGFNVNIDAGISPDTLDTLAQLPAVGELRRGAVVLTGSRPGELISVAAYEDNWMARHDGEAQVRGHIDVEGFEAGEALINTSLARDTGLRPGDRLSLPTPSGMVEIPVQAVVKGGGATGRAAQISYTLLTTLYGEQPVRSINVAPASGVSLDELARQIRESEVGAELRVSTPRQLVADASASVDAQMVPFWTLQRGLLAVSFVAVLSTLLLVGVQRRREMGMLSAVGMTPSTLWRMVVAEAALVGVVAVLFSVAGGLIMLWALLDVSPLLIGFVTPYRPDWMAVPVWGGVAVAVAVVAALWPARRAARTDVVVALQYE